MLYSHFIGRIGKDGAKVINGNNGQFLSMDVATDLYVKGENKTLWVRVRSNKSNHVKLAEYLTRGRLILVEGSLQEPTLWRDKHDETHAQLSLTADVINFVNNGKKRDAISPADEREMLETKEGKPKEDAPIHAPEDEEKDVPF